MKRVALLLVVVVLAGCGSGAKKTAAPQLPHALAQEWAQRADAIAAAGPCAAQRGAATLRTDVIRAINTRKIPQSLLEPLTSKVNALAGHKACTSVQREAHDLAAWLRKPSG